MINKVILIGRTANKPSIKEGKSGNKYCHFSLATNTGYGDKKQTDWHDITSFGKTAELCAQYIDKGSLIMVEGRITYDKYEKDGKTTKTTKIIADNVTFLSSKNQTQSESQQEPQTPQATEHNPNNTFADDGIDFDSVPF
jgi:single-strand DNA-binding protein